MERENTKPETKIRYGAICVSIFKKTGTRRDGQTFETKQVTFDKSVRSASGGWSNIHSFELNDLPKLALACNDAYKLLLQKETPPSSSVAAQSELRRTEWGGLPLPPHSSSTSLFEVIYMLKSNIVNLNGRGPEAKCRQGSFEVSSWSWRKTFPVAIGFRDYFDDEEVVLRRASIRYRGNRAIWCNLEELRDLRKALEQIEP